MPPGNRFPQVLLLVALLMAATAPLARTGDSKDEILERAFAYVDGKEERFCPFQCKEEEHTWVRDGDDALEYEGRSWSEFIKWTPDSTETLDGGKELIFEKEENSDGEDEDDEDEGEKKDSGMMIGFHFLDKEWRGKYRYRLLDFEERDGRRVAKFKLRPEKKKKHLWEGTFWLDAETGALAAADLKPVKRRFGLKSMNIVMELRDFEGMTVPAAIDVRVVAKLPLIFHKKIHTTIEFTDYALLAP